MGFMRHSFGDLFYQFAAVLLVAAVVGGIAIRLKQPLIVSFIAVGILVGPSALGIVEPNAEMDLLAKMGIASLLFLVGLKLDLHLIRALGPVALATGLGQVIFTSVVGFLIALGLGLAVVPAIYVAIALTFSSTIIIIKLLSDKRELDSLHGRIATGFLIVQDIVVVLVMIMLNAVGAGGGNVNLTWEMGSVLLKGLGFLAAVAILMKFVLPRVLHVMAISQELLVLFGVAWAFALAATGDMLGFSKEVGAFVAGVSIASTPYRESIGARLVSLRDFLLLFFFIDLGAQLDLRLLGAQVLPAIVLSVFVLVGNPIIVMAIMGSMGYRKRTGFMAGLTVAQISEFSLILASLGLALGHIQPETMGLVTLVGLVTIGVSTYMILYSHPLYERLSPYLRVFERQHSDVESRDEIAAKQDEVDVIVFGLGRFGRSILSGLEQLGLRIMGIDFDPETVRNCPRDEHLVVRYGDASDPEYIAHLPLDKAKWAISTARERDVNGALMGALRHAGFQGKIAVTSHSEEEARWLEERGADVVFRPYPHAANEVVRVLQESS
jgi:Kef-type K+ transport system membrane component KefB